MRLPYLKDHSEDMTTEEFISAFCDITGEEKSEIFGRGRKEGWLEAEDQIFPDRPISRKNVARILHMYLLKVRNIRDLDIRDAEVLHDLYDCRVCADHVAQVYLRGIMDAKDLKRGGGFLWFDLNGQDDEAANIDHIRRAFKIAEQMITPL